MSPKHEPAIWSSDTGQLIPCFDGCQLNMDAQYQRFML